MSMPKPGQPGVEIAIGWAPNVGPIFAYWNRYVADAHARTMVGVEVTMVEIRLELPKVVTDDLASDFGSDDVTPEIEPEPIDPSDTIVVDVDVSDLDEL